MRKSRLVIVFTFFYAFFIFYLSSQPDLSTPFDIRLLYSIYERARELGFGFLGYIFYPVVRHPDKFIHFLLFTGFGILLNLSFRYHVVKERHSYLFSISLGIIYGILDEFHQSFVPGRSATFGDLYADIAGIFFSQLIVFLYFRRNVGFGKEDFN